MKMAAAEALYDTERAGVVLAVHHRHPGRLAGGLERPGARACCRSWRPVTSTARSRASTTCSAPPSRPRSRRLHARTSPVTYWTFRLMIGFGRWPGCSRCSGSGSRAGAACRPRGGSPRRPRRASAPRSSPTAVGLDLHRDGPPAVGGLRALRTADGVAPRSARPPWLTSLIVFTLLYGVLAVVEVCCSSATPAGPGPAAAARRGGPERGRAAPARRRLLSRPTDRDEDIMSVALTDIWFLLIAVLWTGYFVLEGFDFGVGVLLACSGATRPTAAGSINTIGPLWDGNEVWLLVAGGATFAAFPEWYASLFSGFYLALLIVLVALIVRGVAFEFRGKVDNDRWRRRWDAVIIVGSVVPALLWGVAFANIVRGRAAGRRPRVHRHLLHAAQPVRAARRAGHAAGVLAARRRVPRAQDRRRPAACAPTASPLRLGLAAVPVGAAFLVWTQLAHGEGWTLVSVALAAGALVGAVLLVGRRPRGLGVHPDRDRDRRHHGDAVRLALPRRAALDHRPGGSLTTTNAASTPYTLGIMTWVARRGDPGRARLPGLDLLGVPPPAHRDDIPRATGLPARERRRSGGEAARPAPAARTSAGGPRFVVLTAAARRGHRRAGRGPGRRCSPGDRRRLPRRRRAGRPRRARSSVLRRVVAGRAALAWGSETAAHRASAGVIRQLRGKLVDHVLRLGPRAPTCRRRRARDARHPRAGRAGRLLRAATCRPC